MIDTTTDRISAGAEAESMRARLKPYFEDKREAVITKLIRHHHAESLTDSLMRSGIAHLAALDEMERDLSHKVRLGQKDLEESRRG